MYLSRWKTLLALLFSFALVAAACAGSDEASDDGGTTATTAGDDSMAEDDGDTDDGGDDGAMVDDQMFDGETVTITGPERDDPSVGSIQEALAAFGAERNLVIEYTGDSAWEEQINIQVEAGTEPDISIFPQPGKLADFYRQGDIQALPDDVNATLTTNWSEAWTAFGNVDGVQIGIPVKTDLKSLVWYQPAVFAENGYEIPETFDEFVALTGDMIADGNIPLCVGIESDTATGWAYTDWVEEMMLRFPGSDVYDQWVNHEIPFNDPQVVEQMQAVLDLWNTEGMVFANGGSIQATNFGDNVQPLYDGTCLMHRQASFFASFYGNVVTDDGEPVILGQSDDPKAIDVFYFPSNEGAPVLGAGTLAGAFHDKPEVWAVMEYLSTPEYAEIRQAAQKRISGNDVSGFLSAAIGQDPGVYSPIEQSFLDILGSATVVRFDASDLMPSAVGAGTFWTEGTSAVAGAQDAQEAADKIEASWPS
jgi:alpha-glucoside transport system substrate-binding protein